MSSGDLITIAIPTCNRADVLRRSLECLNEQETEGLFSYCILVVDNGSNDHTHEIVTRFSAKHASSIHYVVEPVRGLPFVRNRALLECHTPWIAFFDDDQLTSPDWLRTLYQTAIRTDARFVGGARDLYFENVDKTSIERLGPGCRKLLGEVSMPGEQRYGSKFLPSTGNVLIERSLFESVGFFDQAVLDGGEDCDLFNRLINHGHVGFYNPKALVHHLIPSSRLDPTYLKWIAFRHGLHLCRRDIQRRGLSMAWVLGICRKSQALLKFLPSKLFAKANRSQTKILDLDCKLEKQKGYMDFLWTRSFPTQGNVVRLQNRSLHRGTR